MAGVVSVGGVGAGLSSTQFNPQAQSRTAATDQQVPLSVANNAALTLIQHALQANTAQSSGLDVKA